MKDGLLNATMDNSTNSTYPEMDGAIPPEIYFFSVFNFVGFLLNAFALFVVTRPTVIPGRIPLTFLVNQLLGDMLSCLVRCFVWATDRDWVLPENEGSTAFCILFYGGLFYWSIVAGSMINLMLLNIERFVSVVHPAHHRKFTPRVIAFLIVLSYSLGVIENITIMTETVRVGHHCQQIEAQQWTRFIATLQMTLNFIIPLIVGIYCNIRIVMVLRQQSQKMRRHGSGSAVANPSAAVHKKLQKDLSTSVCIFSVVFLITNAPISFTYTLNIYDVFYVDYVSWYYEVIIFIMNCYFLINPLVCLLQMRSVRNRAAQILSCFWRKSRSPEIYSVNGVPSATGRGTTLTQGSTSVSRLNDVQPSSSLE